jgi:Tfp pilus assembly protein PilP
MRLAKTLILGITLAVAVPALHAQANPATAVRDQAAAAAKSAQQPAKPADKPVAAKPAASASTPQNKPAPATVKQPPAAAKPAAPATTAKASTAKPAAPKTKAKTSPKPAAAKKTAPKSAKPVTSASAGPAPEPKVAKRDPFESMIGREQAASSVKNGVLPPGKAGLQVSSLRLDGIVRAPTGMIAVVSNPQSRTYFLRDGDQLYDGRVEKIAMDGVSFHEIGKDAFGKPVERQVNKRIYASAGEQQ